MAQAARSAGRLSSWWISARSYPIAVLFGITASSKWLALLETVALRMPQVAELLKERYGITDMASLICDPWCEAGRACNACWHQPPTTALLHACCSSAAIIRPSPMVMPNQCRPLMSQRPACPCATSGPSTPAPTRAASSSASSTGRAGGGLPPAAAGAWGSGRLDPLLTLLASSTAPPLPQPQRQPVRPPHRHGPHRGPEPAQGGTHRQVGGWLALLAEPLAQHLAGCSLPCLPQGLRTRTHAGTPARRPPSPRPTTTTTRSSSRASGARTSSRWTSRSPRCVRWQGPGLQPGTAASRGLGGRFFVASEPFGWPVRQPAHN